MVEPKLVYGWSCMVEEDRLNDLFRKKWKVLYMAPIEQLV